MAPQLSEVYAALLPDTKGILWHTPEELEFLVGTSDLSQATDQKDQKLCNETGQGCRVAAAQVEGRGNALTTEVTEPKLPPHRKPPDPKAQDDPVVQEDRKPPDPKASSDSTLIDEQKPVDPLVSDSQKTPKKGVIKPERKIYRPKLPSEYVEPDLGPDLLDGMEMIFQEFGKSLRKQVGVLPPRDDVIEFIAELHTAELEETIKWRKCPEEHRPAILEIIKDYWDVFC